MLQTIQFNLPEYQILEHRFTAPIDPLGVYLPLFGFHPHTDTDPVKAGIPAEINIFAREFVGKDGENLPRLVYFQGGPGSAGTRAEPLTGWMSKLLPHFRIVMLDQRGTGQSHPLDAHTIKRADSPQAQAAYLACFRADSIVQDAELLRQLLQGDKPWATLGQSFGGFCITNYLSQAPQGLSHAFITAGLPSTTTHARDVYRLTWAQTEQRNKEFFARYPQDESTCWEIARHLTQVAEFLPTGERLTVPRFQMLGINLGWINGLEQLHHLLEYPFVEVQGVKRLSSRFLYAVGNALSFGSNPLYWALHEAIYAQQSSGATAWAAEYTRQEFPQFQLAQLTDLSATADSSAPKASFRFTGEHVFPWQGDEDPALQDLAPAVEILANFPDFPALYDDAQLGKNTVPVVAWVFSQDMFVPMQLSLETAKKIAGAKVLLSNTHHHCALRTDADYIVGELLRALDFLPASNEPTSKLIN